MPQNTPITPIQCPVCNDGLTSKEMVATIRYLIAAWFDDPPTYINPAAYERIKALDRRLALSQS